jgi:hypothetical protein
VVKALGRFLRFVPDRVTAIVRAHVSAQLADKLSESMLIVSPSKDGFMFRILKGLDVQEGV